MPRRSRLPRSPVLVNMHQADASGHPSVPMQVGQLATVRLAHAHVAYQHRGLRSCYGHVCGHKNGWLCDGGRDRSSR